MNDKIWRLWPSVGGRSGARVRAPLNPALIIVSYLRWFASPVTKLLLRNRASVIYPEFFWAPCSKTVLDRKMLDTILMASTSSITNQSLRKIVLRAPAVGAKIWCFSVCLSCSGLPARCSFEGVIYEQVLRHGLRIDFDSIFTFFRSDCPFRSAKEFAFLSPGSAIIFAKLRT